MKPLIQVLIPLTINQYWFVFTLFTIGMVNILPELKHRVTVVRRIISPGRTRASKLVMCFLMNPGWKVIVNETELIFLQDFKVFYFVISWTTFLWDLLTSKTILLLYVQVIFEIEHIIKFQLESSELAAEKGHGVTGYTTTLGKFVKYFHDMLAWSVPIY